VFDRMPEPGLEPDAVEIYPKPGDVCACGHVYDSHTERRQDRGGTAFTITGGRCSGDDCGCREFEPMSDRDEEDFYDKHEPFRPSCPAVVR